MFSCIDDVWIPSKLLLWIIHYISSSFKFSRVDWDGHMSVIPSPLTCLRDVRTNSKWSKVGRRNWKKSLGPSPTISVLRNSWGPDPGKEWPATFYHGHWTRISSIERHFEDIETEHFLESNSPEVGLYGISHTKKVRSPVELPLL